MILNSSLRASIASYCVYPNPHCSVSNLIIEKQDNYEKQITSLRKTLKKNHKRKLKKKLKKNEATHKAEIKKLKKKHKKTINREVTEAMEQAKEERRELRHKANSTIEEMTGNHQHRLIW